MVVPSTAFCFRHVSTNDTAELRMNLEPMAEVTVQICGQIGTMKLQHNYMQHTNGSAQDATTHTHLSVASLFPTLGAKQCGHEFLARSASPSRICNDVVDDDNNANLLQCRCVPSRPAAVTLKGSSTS
eukprot:GHRQ01029948.1.p3 GENE.GHRQ01029948.1~~GHRQ01029948.1.p3  ORF type:complete len:128 (-),score=19.49 GHRQ01029948.1:1336-1719(-)